MSTENRFRDDKLASYSSPEQSAAQLDSTQALLSVCARVQEMDVLTRRSHLTRSELAIIRCNCVDAQRELNRINSWASYEMDTRISNATKIGE